MLASPLDKGLADEIESEFISLDRDTKSITHFFEERYDWDVLASRSVWSFGPEK